MEDSKKIVVAMGMMKVGLWDAMEYREFDLDHQIALAQEAYEQEAEEHPHDCPWWYDWHQCSCDTPVTS